MKAAKDVKTELVYSTVGNTRKFFKQYVNVHPTPAEVAQASVESAEDRARTY